ncbi:MAG: kinase [Acidimicrobiia bacterium]|nr:kinase [Acidimicrobiia bacterium]
MRIVYSKIEHCQRVEEIAHPAVRAVLQFLGWNGGVEIHHDGDLPARSGIGSSSAFTVGLLNAIHALQGTMVSKQQLATESIAIEQEILRETVGSQDQVAAAYGGFHRIAFQPSGEIEVTPVTVAPECVRKLDAHLMLFYTGIARTASHVADTYVSRLGSNSDALFSTAGFVGEALAILNGRDPLTRVGELLHEAWAIKRSLSPTVVSNAEVTALYDSAREAGALGGKLTGAGGGGFMMLFVEPHRQDRVKTALRRLIHVPFSFDSGSRIVFHDSEREYPEQERTRTDTGVPVAAEPPPIA